MNRSRRLWSWVIAFAIVVFLIVCALWPDPFVQAWVTEHQSRALRTFMQNVSRFGDWPEHVALGLGLAAIAWFRRNKKWTRIFLSMLLACALAGATARVIKITTGRARPSVKSEEVWNGPRFTSKYHAFPSGHTAASTAFFSVLFFASRRIGLVFLPIPILIGFSRIYVAAHYLSDVVFAAVLGLLVAYLVARWLLVEVRNPGRDS
jgi:membrane-associated phospholipid phosphatase